ncbi:MAG: helix-turn-helix domain-containing protein, partial [Pseudomonadota bacterium]
AAADLVSQLRNLDREIERRGVGHTLASEMILTSMFIRLVRTKERAVDQLASVADNKTLDQLKELIERHFRHEWKVKDYADVLGLSVGKLRSVTMRTTGKSPIKLVHDRIITEAKRQLIFGEMTIEQIASWLGMSSPAYFTRFFKKETGQSPSHFRTANLEN